MTIKLIKISIEVVVRSVLDVGRYFYIVLSQRYRVQYREVMEDVVTTRWKKMSYKIV